MAIIRDERFSIEAERFSWIMGITIVTAGALGKPAPADMTRPSARVTITV
jgi:hypothetical protein